MANQSAKPNSLVLWMQVGSIAPYHSVGIKTHRSKFGPKTSIKRSTSLGLAGPLPVPYKKRHEGVLTVRADEPHPKDFEPGAVGFVMATNPSIDLVIHVEPASFGPIWECALSGLLTHVRFLLVDPNVRLPAVTDAAFYTESGYRDELAFRAELDAKAARPKHNRPKAQPIAGAQ